MNAPDATSAAVAGVMATTSGANASVAVGTVVRKSVPAGEPTAVLTRECRALCGELGASGDSGSLSVPRLLML